MGNFLLAFCLSMAVFTAVGQTCIHDDLSKSLSFKTAIIRPNYEEQREGPYSVRITVLNKLSQKLVFSTKLSATFIYHLNILPYYNPYASCQATRSYAIGTRQHTRVEDFDYGDLIVADFNFDSKEDFAAKTDWGGNRGPFYAFYLQTATGSFVLSEFLTSRMKLFPNRIDKLAKTLILESDDGRWYYKTSYRLNVRTRKWREINHELVYIGKGPIQDEED